MLLQKIEIGSEGDIGLASKKLPIDFLVGLLQS
jgi:hypothetical protein